MACLFCRIINKEIPSEIVFENDRLIAFRDINPQAPSHILILPKKHVSGLNEIFAADKDILGEIQLAAKEIAAAEGIGSDGYRVVVNCGENAGQAVAHLHYHLLGGRKFSWPPG